MIRYTCQLYYLDTILLLGRPIVKGGNNSNASGNQFQYNAGNTDFQQHQHRTIPTVYSNPPRSKHTMATSLPHHNVSQYNLAQNSIMSQRTNPLNTQMKSQPVPSHLVGMQQPPPPAPPSHAITNMPQSAQRTVNTPMQLVMNQNYNANRAGNTTEIPRSSLSNCSMRSIITMRSTSQIVNFFSLTGSLVMTHLWAS